MFIHTVVVDYRMDELLFQKYHTIKNKSQLGESIGGDGLPKDAVCVFQGCNIRTPFSRLALPLVEVIEFQYFFQIVVMLHASLRYTD